MLDPDYYTKKVEPQDDDTWKGELGVALAGAVSSLVEIPGQTKIVKFVVAAFSSATGTSYAADIALELEYINESQVKINGITEDISDLTGAAVTHTATLGIIGLASIAAGVTLAPSTVLAIGIVGGTSINFAYNRYLDPIVDSTFDSLAGTVDVNLQLKSIGGVVLGGALYQDGLPGSERYAVKQLVERAVSEGMGTLEERMTVSVQNGASQGNIYRLYDGDMLGKIADFFGKSEFDLGQVSRPDTSDSYNQNNFGLQAGNWIVAKDTDKIYVPLDGDGTWGGTFSTTGFLVKDISFRTSSLALDHHNGDNLLIDIHASGNKLFGGRGNDYLYGGEGDDELHGGDGRDVLYGDGGAVTDAQSGEDKLYGGDGDDFLYGGAKSDELHGGNGWDYLHGGDDDSVDYLYGDGGRDRLIGGKGDDFLYGGEDSDFFFVDEGADTIDGGTGFDVVYAHFSTSGMDGDVIDGGTEIDTVDYSRMDDIGNYGIHVTAVGNTYRVYLWDGNSNVGSTYDTLTSIEHIIGTKNNDFFEVGSQKTVFSGFGGNDVYDYSSLDLGGNGILVRQHSSSSYAVYEWDGEDIVNEGHYDVLYNVDRIIGTNNDDIFLASGVQYSGKDGDDIYGVNVDPSEIDEDAGQGFDTIYAYNYFPENTTGVDNGSTVNITKGSSQITFTKVNSLEGITPHQGQWYAIEDYIDNEGDGIPPEPPPTGNPDDRPISDNAGDGLDDFHDGENYVQILRDGSPLVLDIDGNGIGLAALGSAESVYWDIDEDGFREASGWITGGDALLAHDLNQDGKIGDHSELFGNLTTDGFSVLSGYDSNMDNLITAADTDFGNLLVWIDANANGYSESAELYSLNDLNITEINLAASLVDYDIAGNHITHESTFTINGQTQTIVDAWFAFDNMNSQFAPNYNDLNVSHLPDVRGYGDVMDLRIALSLDDSLKALVENVVFESADNLLDSDYDLKGKVEGIMFKWAGVEDVDPMSRGGVFDARKLEFLEKYFGEGFWSNVYSTSDITNYANLIKIMNQSFDKITAEVTTAILLKTDVPYFGEDALYDGYTGTFHNAAPYQLQFIEGNADIYTIAGEAGKHEAFVVENNVSNLILTNFGGEDTIWWKGVYSEDVRYEKSGNDLVIHHGMDTITVEAHFHALTNTNQIEKIAFEHGVVVDLTDKFTFEGSRWGETISGSDGNDMLIGLEGNDTIYAGLGDDVITGGVGNDILYGNTGDDTYEWSLGDGSDQIFETGSGNDTLILHDVSFEDVAFERSGRDLWIHIGNDTLTIDNQYYAYGYAPASDTGRHRHEIETLVFDNGNTFDLTVVLENEAVNTVDDGYSAYENEIITGNLLSNDSDKEGDSFSAVAGSFYAEHGLIDIQQDGSFTYSPDVDFTGKDSFVYFVEDTRGVRSSSEVVFTLIDSTSSNLITIGSESNEHLHGDQNGDALDILYGLGGNDTLYGHNSGDVLIGGVGSDGLYGGIGDDIYEWSVGDGNDYIAEEGGVDILKLHGVAAGDIRFEKDLASNSRHLKIHIGDELIRVADHFKADTSGDTSYITAQIESIVLDDGTTINLTGGLTFTGTDADNEYVYGTHQFGDIIYGMANHDTLKGYEGNDTLIGGTGSDDLYGGASDDIYEWSVGDGNDYIIEENGSDTLRLHNVLESDVTYTKSSNHLKIEVNAETITVLNFYISEDHKLENVVFDDGAIVNLPELLNEAPIAYDDDVILDQDQVFSGNVLVSNGHGADADPDGNALTVVAGTYSTSNGSIVLAANGDFTYAPNTGYNGSDSYVYTVQDQYGVTDTATVNITVRPPNVAPVAQDDDFVGDQDIDVIGNVLSNNGNGADSDLESDPITVVAGTFAATNGSVTISSNGSFTYTPNTGYVGTDSFTYTLEDDRGGSDAGTVTITVNELINNPDAINGTSANETLNGDPGGISNDMLIGNGGNDTLNGKLGNDIYVWSVGDGNDTINETGGVDQIVMHGVTDSDLRFEKSGNYHLKIYAGTESITINYQTYSDYQNNSAYDSYQIETLLLDDGTSIDLTGGLTFTGTAANDYMYGLRQSDSVLYGFDGNDTLNGYAGNDTLEGGTGADALSGGNANDVYVWSVGDGNDTINETGGIDQLVMHGVTESDLRFEKSGNYHLKIHAGTESITINYQTYSDYQNNSAYDYYQIETLLLDNGTMIDLTGGLTFTGTAANDYMYGLRQSDSVLYGFDGNDTLNGYAGNDTLEGGTGADTLSGGNGNDAYIWSVGDGNDTISETGGIDKLVMHGVTESDLRFEKSGNYHLKIYAGTESITINYQTYSDYQNNSAYDSYQIETLLLDDGTSIDLTGGLTFTGTAANDYMYGLRQSDSVLYGLDGNDTLNGYAGNDVLYGGSGIDTLFGQAGEDTFVFEANSAFTANDYIQDFSLSDNDHLDISDLLIDYDPTTDAITDFVQIENSGSWNSILSVDADGGADNFIQVATLIGVTDLTDEVALEISGNLIVT